MVLLCVIFKSVRYARHFLSSDWVLLQAVFMVQPKTTGTAIKIAKETTNDQQNKYDSVKFMKASIEVKVSLKILSRVSIII